MLTGGNQIFPFPAGAGINRAPADDFDAVHPFPAGAGINRNVIAQMRARGSVPRRRGDKPPMT